MELIERESLLDALVEYAGEARGGTSRLVLIAGEAGIGKTALVEALREQLTDVRRLVGASDDAFTPLHFSRSSTWSTRWAGSLPWPAAKTPLGSAYFVRCLRSLPANAGLTGLVLEDVHWADEATLDLVPFLARRLRDAEVILLVTYRDDGYLLTTRSGPPSVSWPPSAVRRVSLPPLTQHAVRALARGLGSNPGSSTR